MTTNTNLISELTITNNQISGYEEEILKISRDIFDYKVSILKSENFIDEMKLVIEKNFISSSEYSNFKNEQSRKIELNARYSANEAIEINKKDIDMLEKAVFSREIDLKEWKIKVENKKRLYEILMLSAKLEA